MIRKKAFTLVELLTVLAIAALLFLIMCNGLAGGCTDPVGASRVLENSGYTDIHITGYRYWIKGHDDHYSTGFEATAPNGAHVTGAVTSGIFGKGNTIRLD
jgi:prepilin-type N-terminal cleavage/methylation domain-containing protein